MPVRKNDLFDLFLDADDDYFHAALPTRNRYSRGESTRDQFRAHRKHEHEAPGVDDGGVELEEALLAKDKLVGAKVHGFLSKRPSCHRVVGPSASGDSLADRISFVIRQY